MLQENDNIMDLNISNITCDSNIGGNLSGITCDSSIGGNLSGITCDSSIGGNLSGITCDSSIGGNLSSITCDANIGDSYTEPVHGKDCEYDHSDNDNTSDATLKSENRSHSFLDDVNKCKSIVNIEDELDSVESESQTSEIDVNMDFSALSIDVNSFDLAHLEGETEDITDDTGKHEHEQVLDEHKSDGLESPDSSQSQQCMSPKSSLHCAVCGNVFSLPKILKCLHTFCLACLLKDFKKNFKFLFCPLCTLRTDVPSAGLCALPDNSVVDRLILSSETAKTRELCVICKLHGVEHECWGQCLDCADKMCKECSEKHTFTRQTAKHTVVSFEQISNDPSLLMGVKTNLAYCKNHVDQQAELFCNDCLVSLCKTCVFKKHSFHDTKEVGLVEAEKRETLRKCLKSVEDACVGNLVDNSTEAAHLIDEKEKKVLKDLTDAKKRVLSAVEKKFDEYFKELKEHYDIKKRKYCTHRSLAILRRKESAECFIDTVQFLLSQGEIHEIAQLESVITARALDIEKHISKVFPKLTHNHTSWPLAVINKKDIQLIDTLNFVSIKTDHKTEGKPRERDIFVENGEIRMNIGNNPGNRSEMSNKFVRSSTQHPVPLLTMPYSNIQPMPLKDQVNGNRGSLLGEYPGPVPSYMDNTCNKMSYSHDAFQGQCVLSVIQSSKHMVQHMDRNGGGDGYNLSQIPQQTKRQSNSAKKKANSKDSQVVHLAPTCLSFENINLKLRSHITVKVMTDRKAPDVVDLCFLSNGNFALVDARNLRLKAFSTGGKFLNFIDDPGPVSITCCANHLIWTSQYSSVKLYDLGAERIVGVKKLDGTLHHALTSFNNMKYLISSRGNIEAYCIDGYTAHVIRPRDRDGNPLHDISHIATRSQDQVVIVDRQQKKVVVTNFDGNCIGEFHRHDTSQGDFDPSGVCITEHNYIFVTDRRNNKLILLSQNAKFIKEWKTNIKSPTCVACNGNGLLVVAGEGTHVSVYLY